MRPLRAGAVTDHYPRNVDRSPRGVVPVLSGRTRSGWRGYPRRVPTAALLAADAPTGLTGVSGFVADVLVALGAVGVGLLTLLETVFPPIPSEVVLPLAGFLVSRGRMGLVAVLVAATLGSLVGALVLYAMGARLGQRRARALLSRLPLVDPEDVDRAADWFHRHGPWAVLLGRLVPGVRSLVSLPAGAQHMPLLKFCVLTTVGSALWNALLVGGGLALGSQWRLVEEYSGWVDVVLVGGAVALVGWALVRRRRRARTASSGSGGGGDDDGEGAVSGRSRPSP